MNATIFEAKTNLSELIRRAKKGEKVIITSGREKTPEVELIAVKARKPQPLGAGAHLNIRVPDDFFAPLTEAQLREWHGDGER